MKDRIDKLPKSSEYYMDMATLIDAKITLGFGESRDKTDKNNKKHDSTKKMALSFI
jgi:hypothetical protein